MITRDQAFETLKSLSPAAVFLDSYRTKKLPYYLDIYFGPPEEFFLAPETLDEQYTEGRLIPILDDGNFGLVTFFDPHDRALVVKDVECPDEPRDCFSHWQQYLAALLIRIGESIDDDTKLDEISTFVGFKYYDQLLRFFGGYGKGESYEAFQKRRRGFVATIGP